MSAFSPDQQKAFDTIIWDTSPLLMVYGHGGTGKTHVACKAIEFLTTKKRKCLILCPTHQAKDQFYMKLGALANSNQVDLSTIASFLAQFPQLKPDGRLVFNPGAYEESNYNYIFVDEASMVSEWEMRQLSRHSSGKVVFLGDYAQLTPVMKKQNTVGPQIKTIELTTQHRNSNAILDLCEELRKGLTFPQQSKGEITVYDTWEDMSKEYLKVLKNAPNPQDYSWLSYHNEEVDYFRKVVHEEMYGNLVFAPGQHIRLDSYCHVGTNGTIVKVVDAQYAPYTLLGGLSVESYVVTLKNDRTGKFGKHHMMSYDSQNQLVVLEEQLIEDCKLALQRKDNKEVKFIHEQLAELRSMFVIYSSPFVQSVHKSQGRSIPHVYVDTLSINEGREKQRLMYVSCSRAMHSLSMVKTQVKKKKGVK